MHLRFTKSPLIAGSITLLLSYALWQYTLTIEANNLNGATAGQAEAFTREAEARFAIAAQDLSQMVERFDRTDGFTREIWDFDASQFLRAHPAALNVSWVDDQYILTWTATRNGEVGPVGLDVRSIPGTQVFLDRVRRENAVQSREIFKVEDSEIWAHPIYVPVTVNNAFNGFVGTLFNTGDFLQQIHSSFPGMHVRVCANGALVYESHAEPITSSHPQYWLKELTFGNTVFQVEVVPTRAFAASMMSHLSDSILAFGIILTLLVAWVAHKNSVIRRSAQLIKRQSLALSQTDDAMLMSDTNHRVIGVNEAASELFGFSETELLSMNPRDLIDSSHDIERLAHEWQASIELGLTWRDTVPCRTKDGKLIQVSISANSLDDERGNPIGTISMARDVTAEHERNAKLRVSEKRFRSIFESNYNGIAIRERDENGDLKLIEANQTYLDMLGYSLAELQNHTGYELSASPEDEAISREAIATLRRTGFSDDVDITYRRKSGSTIDISATMWKILDENGGHFQTISMLKDNTARKSAERRMDEAQRIAKIGGWDLDLMSGVMTWSPEMYRLFNRDTSQKPYGYKKFSTLIHPDDHDDHERERNEASAAHTPFDRVSRVIMSDGSVKYMHFITHTTFDANGKPMRRSGTVQDVTQQKELEERLRHTETLQSLGQLTGGVAHDFNNILGIISSTAHFMKMDRDTDQFVEQNVDRILRAVNRGAGLTDKLLSFSRKQRLVAKNIETNTFVVELGKVLERTLGENVQLDIKVAPDAWAVYADENQLSNAILNLALNGRDAMDESGHLIIDVKNIHFEEGDDLPSDALEPGDYVALSVTDNGSGMSPETLEKAFEPFFTTKDVGKGSGLGLSMVHGFAEQSQGAATIQSEYGIGTRVTLFLPGKEITIPTAKTVTPAALTTSHGKYTILVVEDQPELRLVTDQILRRLGYKTLLAGNAEDALALAANTQYLDAAFLDVLLPGGVNGTVLAQKLRETHPTLKIMFTTGYASQDVLERLQNFDHDGVFRKPLEVSELAETLVTVLNPISKTEENNVVNLEDARRLH